MPAEQQVLDFLFKASDRGWTAVSKRVDKSLDKINENVTEIAGKMDKKGRGEGGIIGMVFGRAPFTTMGVLSKQLQGQTASLLGLDAVVGSMIRDWSQFYTNMVAFRKETGMSSKELGAFSNQLIETSAKYGTELDRAANIARFLATGADAAKKNIGELAGAAAFMSKNMGVAEDVAGRLGRVITTEWREAFTGRSLKQIMFGFKEMSKAGNLINEDLIGAFLGVREAMNEFENDVKMHMLPRFLALTGAANKTTGRFRDMESIFRKIGVEGSNLNLTFRTMGQNTDVLFAKIAEESRGLTKGTTAFQALAETYQMSTNELETLVAAREIYTKNVARWNEAINVSEGEINARVRAQQTAVEKLGETWIKTKNQIAKAGVDVVTANEHHLNMMIKGVGKTAENAGKFYSGKQKGTLGGKLSAAGGGLSMMADFFWHGAGGLYDIKRQNIGRIEDKNLQRLTDSLFGIRRQFQTLKEGGFDAAQLQGFVNTQAPVLTDPRIQHMMQGGIIPKEMIKVAKEQAERENEMLKKVELIKQSVEAGQKASGKGQVDTNADPSRTKMGKSGVMEDAVGSGLAY